MAAPPKNVDRTTVTVAGIVLAVALFLAINIFSNVVFKTAQIDLTEENPELDRG